MKRAFTEVEGYNFGAVEFLEDRISERYCISREAGKASLKLFIPEDDSLTSGQRNLKGKMLDLVQSIPQRHQEGSNGARGHTRGGTRG